jgi:phosphoribosyl-ATP pyrophosphohydrolase/phosphoribosyl-AMP cyclohydrolase
MIIASIDLQKGKAVQLRNGRKKVLQKDDPPALAAEFDRCGDVALIDLDAALGRGNNEALMRRILPLARCRVGGGIRSVEKAKEWLDKGAAKVIIGSAAFSRGGIDRPFLEELLQAVDPRRVIIAVDADQGEVVSHGWRHGTGLSVVEAVRKLAPYCGEFLYTCVEREGTLQGIDVGQVARLRGLTGHRLTVAGGVASPEEVENLSRLEVDIQLGMALYSGRMTLAAAFIAALDWRRELLPTVVRDEAGRVLMLAYSSRESLDRTFKEGRMSYFSRSRQCLWRKGDTSGNSQELLRLRADCDADALLATVRPQGPACHTGEYSCFGDDRFSWHDLFAVVSERLQKNGPGSYTRSLTKTKVRQKLLEEAAEVILAGKRSELVWEAADLLYFMTVLLAREKIGLEPVMRELKRRRQK